MPAKVEEKDNRRRHLRYRDPESSVVKLLFSDEPGKGAPHVGLLINESFRGMAVVYVGTEKLAKGSIIHWQETDMISTPCKVIRCTELDEDVYSVALQIEP